MIDVHNRIKHCSDWDGTLRSYKAEAVIEKLHPKDAPDLARKLALLINRPERYYDNAVYDVQYGFLKGNKKLVDFVKANKPDSPDWWDYYITHIDEIDIIADIWKLSPAWRKRYPTHKCEDGHIREGWHDALSGERKKDGTWVEFGFEHILDDELSKRRERAYGVKEEHYMKKRQGRYSRTDIGQGGWFGEHQKHSEASRRGRRKKIL